MLIYKWHSINLVPSAHLVPICDDDKHETQVGTLLQVTFLGFVLNVELPPMDLSRSWSTPLVGPLYSRRRRCWYRSEA